MKNFIDRFLFQFIVGIFFGVTLGRADALGIVLLIFGLFVGLFSTAAR